MSTSLYEDRGDAVWRTVIDAPILTAAQAADALHSMELTRARDLYRQAPAAQRIEQLSGELGRVDLQMRAQLILADIAARSGQPERATEIARAVQARIEHSGDPFLAARCYYVLAWIDYSIGNYPAAHVNAVRSVDLLPEGTNTAILIDHIMMIGIATGRSAEAQQYFDEALILAHKTGDPLRLMSVHNNTAYAATERGDLDTATEHVDAMHDVSSAHGIPPLAVHAETAARAYILSGRYDDAISTLSPLLERSLDPTISDPDVDLDPNSIPLAMITLAIAHRHCGRLEVAETLLADATKLAEEGQMRMVLAGIKQEQAYVAAARDDYRTAFELFTSFHDTMQQLHTEEEQAQARIAHAAFDAERNRRNAERFREMAMRDALTGIYNRRYMDELLAKEIEIAQRDRTPLSLAIIDIDYFKLVNDQFSHDTGDEVLREMTALFLELRPDTDTVCRLGGEEFVVIMPGVDEAEALRRSEVLRSAVAAHQWPALQSDTNPDESYSLTISIGVATAQSGLTSPSALLSEADRSLYAAKRSGRNRVLGTAR